LGALSATSTNVYLTLFEEDTWIKVWGVADISGDPGTVQQDERMPAPLSAVFKGQYDLITNSFTGDPLTLDGGLFKTSGDYDGSTGSDQNDASLWSGARAPTRTTPPSGSPSGTITRPPRPRRG
jgi:hypothetical protein